MTPKFICHPDFASEAPIPMFHKQKRGKSPKEGDPKFLNRHVLFRKKFDLNKTSPAILQITADDYYKLYVNGVFVTLGPAASYPHAYNYNEIDVTPYLRKGENLFAVHTYYQGLTNRVWVSGDRRQMLWCRLLVDGETVLVSDESWKYHDHTAFRAIGKVGYDTAFCECYDSSAAEVGFEKENFEDSSWENASVLQNADHVLQKQTTKQLDIYSVKPVSAARVGNTLRLDFGQEMVGYLFAKAKGQKGDKLILHYGEELNADGSVRFEMRCNCRYEEAWILSGGTDELNQFDYKAFRYAEIEIPEGAEVSEVFMTVRHYPYTQRAVYPTTNKDLQRIIRLCADTAKYGTQENYVDCPTREKGQYLGDVSIAARAQAVLTGDTSMMKKAIVDFCESTFICHGMMAVSCSSLMQEIADYSLQFPAQVLWVCKMDGDRELLEICYPYVEGIYRYFKDYAGEDGLLAGLEEKWNLVDWPENLRDGYVFPEVTQPHNVLNAFWLGFLQAMDEMAAILKKEPTGMTETVKASFRKTFYDEERGLFADDPAHSHFALHSNALPLLFGMAEGDEALTARLIDFICEKKLTAAGVYMAYFVLEALKAQGRDDLCRKLILDKGCWLNMLSEGATTTFEAWGKDQKWNTSLFHPWASAPAIILAQPYPNLLAD